ncbi:MAG: FkbM family methyltransferase [Rhodobacteraceae bacterium]|nr:FkbM family methyltransferase [Paracoccaceae bacterium]
MTVGNEPDSGSGIAAVCHGIRVPEGPHLGPRMIQSMSEGRYEAGEIAGGLAVIPEGARILELGAGAGVVGAVIARHRKAAAVLSVEANPALIPHVRRLHDINGLSRVMTVEHGVVLTAPSPPATVTFHVTGNFLGSSLTDTRPGKTRPVEVPVIPYDALRGRFPHDAIVMDIEGGELDFLRHADLSGIRALVAEFHRDIYGKEGARECMRLLDRAGLKFREDASGGGVRAFAREG